jgi:ABC-type polysaccharide/polyol phosphate transport system ATPase subunit
MQSSNNTKRILKHLRIGDNFAGINKFENYDKFNDFNILDTQLQFTEHLYRGDYIDTLIKNNITNGVLISVCGSSGSGKSTLANKIKGLLLSRNPNIVIDIVSRDIILMDVCYKAMGFETPEYNKSNYKFAYNYYIKTNKKHCREIDNIIKQRLENGLYNRNIVILDTVMSKIMYICLMMSIINLLLLIKI